jgi:hypothetical protein
LVGKADHSYVDIGRNRQLFKLSGAKSELFLSGIVASAPPIRRSVPYRSLRLIQCLDFSQANISQTVGLHFRQYTALAVCIFERNDYPQKRHFGSLSKREAGQGAEADHSDTFLEV